MKAFAFVIAALITCLTLQAKEVCNPEVVKTTHVDTAKSVDTVMKVRPLKELPIKKSVPSMPIRIKSAGG